MNPPNNLDAIKVYDLIDEAKDIVYFLTDALPNAIKEETCEESARGALLILLFLERKIDEALELLKKTS